MLIEPDLVLTASHCVRENAGVRGAGLTFRPSNADGKPGFSYRGYFVTMHPTWLDFLNLGLTLSGSIARDIALVRLLKPVEASVATPIPVAGSPEDRSSLTMVSYRGGRPPLMVRDCPVRSLDDSVLVVDCMVRQGESGAPVLAGTADRPEVVGIVTRSGQNEDTEIAICSALGDAYTLLRNSEPPLKRP